MGYLPISKLQKLVAQQENLLVPDDRTGHFSSPLFYFLLAAATSFQLLSLTMKF